MRRKKNGGPYSPNRFVVKSHDFRKPLKEFFFPINLNTRSFKKFSYMILRTFSVFPICYGKYNDIKPHRFTDHGRMKKFVYSRAAICFTRNWWAN